VIRRVSILAYVAALVLTACGRKEEEAAPAPAKSAAPARKADPYQVWTRGVGPISEHTPFTPEAVGQAFPDLTVEQAYLHQGDNAAPILRATGPQGQSMEIQGDVEGKVATIVVQGGPFRGPGGEPLLLKWPHANFAASDCRMGEGRFLNALVCRRNGEPRILYVFAVPGWASSAVPPPEVLSQRAFLREFVWIAPVR